MAWLKTCLIYAFVTLTPGAWGSTTKEPYEASHYRDLYKSMIADSCMGANYDFFSCIVSFSAQLDVVVLLRR